MQALYLESTILSFLQASVHIPFLLDGKGSYSYRGRQYMDGSLYDFFWGNNSELLTCNGDALVVDYVSSELFSCACLFITVVVA